MDIDPKLYGKLCPKCREAVDAFDGEPEKDEPEAEENGMPKPLDDGKKKAMSRMNGLAIIITPAEQVSRSEAADSIDGGKDSK